MSSLSGTLLRVEGIHFARIAAPGVGLFPFFSPAKSFALKSRRLTKRSPGCPFQLQPPSFFPLSPLSSLSLLSRWGAGRRPEPGPIGNRMGADSFKVDKNLNENSTKVGPSWCCQLRIVIPKAKFSSHPAAAQPCPGASTPRYRRCPTRQALREVNSC